MTFRDAQMARKLMTDELETTNQYEAMAVNADSPATAKLLQDIADEEKVHAGEGAALLAQNDSRAEPAMREGVKEARDIMKFEDMLKKSNEEKDRERGYPPMSNTELMRDPYRHVQMQYNDQVDVNGNRGEHIENAEGCSVKAGKKNDGVSGSYSKSKPEKGSFEYMFRKANDINFRELTEADDDGSFTAENYDEWYPDWYGEGMPKNFDWMRYHQINDAKRSPDRADQINDPATDKFVRDWYDYIKWNNRGNEAGLSEIGGIYDDASAYLGNGDVGRQKFIEDSDIADYMDDDHVKGLMASFDTAQGEYGKKWPIRKANGVTIADRRVDASQAIKDIDEQIETSEQAIADMISNPDGKQPALHTSNEYLRQNPTLRKNAPPGTKGVIVADADAMVSPTEDDAINTAALDTALRGMTDEIDEVIESGPVSPERDAMEQKVWDEHVPPSDDDAFPDSPEGVIDAAIDNARAGRGDYPKPK